MQLHSLQGYTCTLFVWFGATLRICPSIYYGFLVLILNTCCFIAPPPPVWDTFCYDVVPTTGGNAGGAPCNFPFIYREVSYSTCTSVEHTEEWCATTPNYDTDETWGNCEPVPTVGGNSGGAPCVFPFIYMGASYTSCTTISNNGIPWCATTPSYDENGMWGMCTGCEGFTTTTTAPVTTTPVCPVYTMGTRGNVDPGTLCVFPFVYRDVTYSECTNVNNDGIDWCSTTADYPTDTRWGDCAPSTEPDGSCITTAEPTTPTTPTTTLTPCPVFTEGGNANGAECVFPFLYLEDTYGVCTPVNNDGVDWCSTTPDYDADRMWGNCLPSRGPDNECLTTTMTTPTTTTMTTPTTTTMTTPTTTELTTPTTTLTPCTVYTTGGNAEGAPCEFPFVYRDSSYGGCIDINHDQDWCAITENYDTDRAWGNCLPSRDQNGDCVTPTTIPPTSPTTTSLPPCIVFTEGGNDGGNPCSATFIYREVTYEMCTPINNDGVDWCATTENYDIDMLWGNCLPIVRDDDTGECVYPTTAPPTTPTTTTEVMTSPTATLPTCPVQTEGGNSMGAECVFPFIYREAEYMDCIDINFDRLWCSTTPNYDLNRLWGICLPVTRTDTGDCP